MTCTVTSVLPLDEKWIPLKIYHQWDHGCPRATPHYISGWLFNCIYSAYFDFHPRMTFLFSTTLRKHPPTVRTHTRVTPFRFRTHSHSGWPRFAHLTERCRISVRDLLMLLAILISSFSSESVYWASWSRLRAQSARLASSSACTVCLKRRPRGQSPVAQIAVPLQFSKIFWHKTFSDQSARKRTSEAWYWCHSANDFHLICCLLLYGSTWLMNAEWQQCKRRGVKREREIQKVGGREEGSGLCSYNTLTKKPC